MIHHQSCKQVLGQARPIHRRLETLAHKDRLGRMFQDDRIAGQQRRRNRIHRRQIRIVPRCDDKNDTDWSPLDAAAEPGLFQRHDRRQRLVADLDQRAQPLLEAAHFAAVTNGTAHLHRQFGHDFLILGEHRGQKFRHLGFAFGKRSGSPLTLRPPCRGQNRFDLAGRRNPAARHLATVDGRNTDDVVHHASIAEPVGLHNSDDLEIARQFPIRDGPLEFALLPFPAHRVMIDEAIAEQFARRLGCNQPIRRVG
jgi:hypothetical protein